MLPFSAALNTSRTLFCSSSLKFLWYLVRRRTFVAKQYTYLPCLLKVRLSSPGPSISSESVWVNICRRFIAAMRKFWRILLRSRSFVIWARSFNCCRLVSIGERSISNSFSTLIAADWKVDKSIFMFSSR